MPFQTGNKLSPGGKKGNKGGRPSKSKKEIARAAAEIARDYIEQHIQPVLNNYLKLAKGWDEKRYTALGNEYEEFRYDGATTRHFVDKLLPTVKGDDGSPPAVTYNFIQFNHNPAQLSSQGLPVTVLAGDDGREAEEAGGESLAPAQRERQDGFEFHSFSNVSRKRR